VLGGGGVVASIHPPQDRGCKGDRSLSPEGLFHYVPSSPIETREEMALSHRKPPITKSKT